MNSQMLYEHCDSRKAYAIRGVEIFFPYKAYPSQLSMMDKITKSLTRKQNCLLESPTGSGKSIALLCSCLAWQIKIQREVDEWKQEKNVTVSKIFENSACNLFTLAENKTKTEIKDFNTSINDTSVFNRKEDAELQKRSLCEKDIKNEDFKPSKRFRMSSMISSSHRHTQSPSQVGKIEISSVSEVDKPNSTSDFSGCWQNVIFSSNQPKHLASNRKGNERNLSGNCQHSDTAYLKSMLGTTSYQLFPNLSCEILNSGKKEQYTMTTEHLDICKITASEYLISSELNSKLKCRMQNVPKIFFGTRTHKQISQLIRELKKTIYKNAKMTILSSRERTCIHNAVSKMENKKEGCDELINAVGGPMCNFYHKSHKVTHDSHSCLVAKGTWDLEDFVEICRKAKACPYFATRNLLLESDIIFCPYNYLIDPLIRASMEINLKDNVVIMDEAHNIEDSARDAASFSVKQAELLEAVEDVNRLVQDGVPSVSHNFVANILCGLNSWISKNSKILPDYNSFDRACKVWSGEEMVALLSNIGAGPDDFQTVKEHFGFVLDEDREPESDNLKLSGSTIFLLKSLLLILGFVYREKLIYVQDYKCVILKTKAKPLVLKAPQKKSFKSSTLWTLSLNFWCLNPAVAFSDFKGNVHSLIVASGTLSPMASFQSELNIPFAITLEANHVICKSQLWVGTVSKGPKGTALNATYHNAETFSFQDEIGLLVLKICTIIPHGVLCFLPSYSMMDKLISRWQMTGLWTDIHTHKFVVSEPKGNDKYFNKTMTKYYDAVKESENEQSELNGALFLAVCRGKVSEGLDFSDNNARAVITVGIPFPNIKDTQVDLKKQYNNIHSVNKDIMSGNDWYETQAFRALNQALGRCIRHKTDYGALIIVDERFQKRPRYVGLLSKWISKEVVHYQTFSEAAGSLKDFAKQTGLYRTSPLGNFSSQLK